MQRRSLIIGYAAGLLASFFWGVHSVIIRYLTQEGISPYLIAGLRLYIGIITLLILLGIERLVHFQRKTEPVRFQVDKLFWIAAGSLGINFILFQLGLRYTLASDANLIENFAPVVVLILTSVFLPHRIKEIAPNQAFWMKVFQIVLIGSVGASLLLVNNTNNSIIPNQTKFFGDSLEFLGMIFFSVFIIYSSEYSKIHAKIPSLCVTLMTLVVAAIPVTLFVPFGEIARITAFQWELIALIGIFSTGVAYWLWHIASKRLNVIPLTLNLVYIGIITVLTEIIFLEISLDWKFIVGGILMLTASVTAERMNVKAKIGLDMD